MTPSFAAILVALANTVGAAGQTVVQRAHAQSAPDPAKPAAADDLMVDRSRYGRILVDGHGRTLYLFTRDRGGKSRCYGDCAAAWPPQFAHGDQVAGAGLDQSKLGTTTRHGGAKQVTYGGHPLYYYVSDRKPGQILCQNVAEFGGTWLVVSPVGRAIR
jgi:predicted lipoprotein with Yx(FWY)xxD motif